MGTHPPVLTAEEKVSCFSSAKNNNEIQLYEGMLQFFFPVLN